MRISDWSSDVCSSDLLMARVQARREIAGGDEILDFLSTTQRKIYKAQLAFDEADEIEDFQAVGLQCRAAMTSFAREIVAAGLFDDLNVPPKKGDYTAWSVPWIGATEAGGGTKAGREERETGWGKEVYSLSVWCTI